jgi:sugar/nucleoside kinase (ribokinase family)
MNQSELTSIIGKSLDSRTAVIGAFAMLHDAGPRIAIITAGRDGAILSQRPEGGIYHIPAVHIAREIDSTGCGDTLSASFLYSYLTLGNAIKALEIANHYAAAKTTFSGLAGFANLNEILPRIGPPTKAEKLLAFPT